VSTSTVTELALDRLSDADLAALVAFEQTMWAEHAPEEPALAEEPAVWMATRKQPNADRFTWVVRADGNSGGDELAGAASLTVPRADNPHLGTVELRVAPPFRRQGLGRLLLAAVATRAQEEHRRVLAGWTWDLVAAGEEFARTVAGAESRQVIRRSYLDLRTVDSDLVRRWLDVPAEVRARYELWTVVGPYPPDQYGAIADVEAVMNTAPHDDLDVEDEVRDADWVAQREAQQAASPGERWTIFVRERATARLVGYTQVFRYEDWPGHVDQGNTGVHPDHRGHGLGRWLKAAMLDRVLCERPESFRVRTTNAFSNAPMLAINDELGFVVTATQTAWETDVDEVCRRLRST
jgi:RimJ/RimL family protein N-acetyltransferase